MGNIIQYLIIFVCGFITVYSINAIRESRAGKRARDIIKTRDELSLREIDRINKKEIAIHERQEDDRLEREAKKRPGYFDVNLRLTNFRRDKDVVITMYGDNSDEAMTKARMNFPVGGWHVMHASVKPAKQVNQNNALTA